MQFQVRAYNQTQIYEFNSNERELVDLYNHKASDKKKVKIEAASTIYA